MYYNLIFILFILFYKILKELLLKRINNYIKKIFLIYYKVKYIFTIYFIFNFIKQLKYFNI